MLVLSPAAVKWRARTSTMARPTLQYAALSASAGPAGCWLVCIGIGYCFTPAWATGIGVVMMPNAEQLSDDKRRCRTAMKRTVVRTPSRLQSSAGQWSLAVGFTLHLARENRRADSGRRILVSSN